jgi:hypothetical protein
VLHTTESGTVAQVHLPTQADAAASGDAHGH